MRLLDGDTSPKSESPKTVTPGDFFSFSFDDSAISPSAPPKPSRFTPQDKQALSVWLVDENDCEPYEQFIKTHGQESLYHTLAWRRALLREGIGDPYYLMAMQGDDAVGVLPLFSQIGPLGCRRFNSLPGTPDVGVLSRSPEIAAALIDRARVLARKLGVSEIVQRQFVRTNGDIPSAGPYWLRTPANELLSYARPQLQDPNHLIPPKIADDEHTMLIQASLLKDSDGIDAILVGLSRLNAHPGHLSDTNGKSAAVWVTKRDVAYVLGYQAATDPSDHLALMARIATHISAAGVRWMDFALPRALDRWDQQLLLLDDTYMSIETRLSIPGN